MRGPVPAGPVTGVHVPPHMPAGELIGLSVPSDELFQWWSDRVGATGLCRVSTLRASVSAGEAGPVIMLSGEADITTVAELSELVTAQLYGETLHLTIDMSGLSFADSASVRVLVLAATTVRQRGGGLVLLRPQRTLVLMLEIVGADQMITIRRETGATPGPEPGL